MYQRVRNFSFSENVVHILTEWSPATKNPHWRLTIMKSPDIYLLEFKWYFPNMIVLNISSSKNKYLYSVKMDGSILDEKYCKILRSSFSFKLLWMFYIVAVAKTISEKIWSLIYVRKFLSSEFVVCLCKPTIRSCMDTVIISVLVSPIAIWIFWISYRDFYLGLSVLHLLLLLNSWPIVEMYRTFVFSVPFF